MDDLETYLDATRAELLFARGVIFVEGDAEETLLPVFSSAVGHVLDDLSITVCNVAGTNFGPYVKLAEALGMPYAVITDWDPLDGTKPPLGKKRTLDLWDEVLKVRRQPPVTPTQRVEWEGLDFAAFATTWASAGIFLNDLTFEVSVANTPSLLMPLLDILDAQGFGSIRTKRIANWRASSTPVDAAQLLAMIADIGKGRLSAKLSKKATGLAPPKYIADAIAWVVSRVQ